MIYYADEVIEFGGKRYTPVTDVIHEEINGMYSNVVKDQLGNRYEAYYNQDHYDNDDWSKPVRVVELI